MVGGTQSYFGWGGGGGWVTSVPPKPSLKLWLQFKPENPSLYTPFETKPGKCIPHFRPKSAWKPYPKGRHIPLWSFGWPGVPPPLPLGTTSMYLHLSVLLKFSTESAQKPCQGNSWKIHIVSWSSSEPQLLSSQEYFLLPESSTSTGQRLLLQSYLLQRQLQ